jgi:hypothetical protein
MKLLTQTYISLYWLVLHTAVIQSSHFLILIFYLSVILVIYQDILVPKFPFMCATVL